MDRIISFEEAASFHGHVCPGLAMGYRVAVCAVRVLGVTPGGEDILAVVENNSCAVDAIQVVTGCTFGKGNLFVNNFGKQVYSLAKRPSGLGVRIAVKWIAPPESAEESSCWQKYMAGDRSAEVVAQVNRRKAAKVQSLLNAEEADLFEISQITLPLPEKARIFPTITCQQCGEKMMEPKAKKRGDGSLVCIPCYERNGSS